MDNEILDILLEELEALDIEGSYKEADELEKNLQKVAQVAAQKPSWMTNGYLQKRERLLNDEARQRSQARSQQWKQQPSQGKQRDYQSQLKLYLQQIEDHIANNPLMDKAKQARLFQEYDRISKLMHQ